MAIGILKPLSNGSLFVEQVVLQPNSPGVSATTTTRPRVYVDDMLRATQADLEKILIAKGFPTAGTYLNIDEMTYSQKTQATLLLLPDFDVSLQVVRQNGYGTGQIATVSGTVALQLLEPMTREKIWMKRVQLPPVTKEVPAGHVNIFAPPDQQADNTRIQDNALIEILNSFYASTMQKVWDQLDPQELVPLKKQVDEVRAKSGYNRK